MIEKDELPVDAVSPTPAQRVFLKRLIHETTEHAQARGHTDIYFQGQNDNRYFCAYSSSGKRGSGAYVFGFESRRSGLRMTFPDAVPDPLGVSCPWTQKPEVHRSFVTIEPDPPEEKQNYLIGLAKKSVDYFYAGAGSQAGDSSANAIRKARE
jgi:hypothetical protein